MFTINKVLEEFLDILKQESDADVKKNLSNIITNLVTNNYTTIQNENYNTKKELENENYKEFLNKELENLESEIAKLKKEAEQEETDNYYSVITENDTELETKTTVKQIAYQNKLVELEYLKQNIYDINFPIYIKEQEYKVTLEKQISSIYNCQTNINERIGIVESNERDIYKNINELKNDERETQVTLNGIRTGYSKMFDDVDSLDKKYTEKMFDLETRLNLDYELLNEKINTNNDHNNNTIKSVRFDLNNEIESLDNRITDYESSDYGPFTVPSDSNYEEAPLINNMDRTGLISPIVSQDSESNLVCPFPFTPINQKIE